MNATSIDAQAGFGRRLLERALFPEAPATRLAAMRILIGTFATVYLLARAPHLTSFSQFTPASFHPLGPVSVLDGPLPQFAVIGAFGVALLSSIFATAGYRYAVSGPLFGLSLLWVLTYRNSWGMIFHTENLLVVHALVVGAAPAADAWSLDHRAVVTSSPSRRFGWPLRILAWVVVLSYVVAGVAKLRAAGWEWSSGDELRSHIAFDAVRKLELGSIHSSVGAALVSHAWVFPPLAWLTLAFELGAPLAMLGGRWATLWCLTAWGFHLGVLVLMAIFFPYPLLGLAYAPFFAVERVFERWVWPSVRRLTNSTPPATTDRT